MRILVVRNDRLGDALLALPTLLALREHLPTAKITFYCNPVALSATKPWLFQHTIDPVSHVIASDLRSSFDAVLFLYLDSDLLFSAWTEWVPLRIGTYSRPVSFLLLNGGLSQHRSRADKNEAEYNLDLGFFLLKKLGVNLKSSTPSKIALPINQQESIEIDALLERMGLAPDFVAVHPGMGGSALNYPVDGYTRLIVKLLNSGLCVVISRGPSDTDREIVEELKRQLPAVPVVSGLTIEQTMEFFRKARAVVAPSTGPLHLAHYVGTTTLGIYSPLKPQEWRRWYPWGGTGVVHIATPNVSCRESLHCAGANCADYFCLDRLRPEDLLLRQSFVLLGS